MAIVFFSFLGGSASVDITPTGLITYCIMTEYENTISTHMLNKPSLLGPNFCIC